ncbi:SGNH/GDSL hydrolase family protein [Bradyrhizobium sp. ARR65]|uniref:SGNH/GDSL hydrolase family protein n=1 Tax=Bradyrhizobium sp. ARR65 TaxID=1040989 RepID=UPI0004632A5D|nr:SGNH/GDSL hydrolase family protein [Bradyrhizobium sp. ARR65]
MSLLRSRSSCPFRVTASLSMATLAAALMLFAPIPAGAQGAQAAPSSQPAAASDNSVTPVPADGGSAATTAVGDQGQASQQSGAAQNKSPDKSLAAKALDKVKQVAKSAGDIFSRVPCLPPKGGAKPMGTLPHVAAKLAAGKPIVIIAFGSSSTQGYGTSSPEYTYPNRLAAQLRRQYPSADITVINAGRGGEDAPEMMKRLQSSVIDLHPDLVIWQVGTNAVLRNLDPDATAKMVDDGVARIQAAGSDVVLVDLQYSPRVTEHPESASKMIRLLGKVAQLHHIGIFPRFEVMREWHEQQALPIDSFVIADGLHMNDWGYACFAQLLGDDIIRSVGQLKIGVNVPATVQTYRPM